ncbi:protein FAM151B isoform X1 [Strix uralensis]|uniref:protein FAM151B isoform X1 n=1 Tax=Strix uralensis TaxID=36305 RepID=UPI003DA6EE71
MADEAQGAWSQEAVDHFLRAQCIRARDAAAIRWFHAANSKARAGEAASSEAPGACASQDGCLSPRSTGPASRRAGFGGGALLLDKLAWLPERQPASRRAGPVSGDVHMIEADVLLRGGKGGNGEPIMAHPPETDSDNTLQEWLKEIVSTNKGIKLDFKSLEAVQPSLQLLEHVKQHLRRPVWINADILPGPNGRNSVVDAEGFLDTVTSFFPDVTLSLGWTTGWHPDKHNKGYDWMMVKEMAQICSALPQRVTFPVRAALVRQSISELCWLMQQSDRYSLTVWTGKEDVYSIEDLLYIRENFDKSRVYYDILEPQNSEFKKAIGVE